MRIDRLDHIVLTVEDIPTTISFYCDILGMAKETFGENRVALTFGSQKINLHQKGHEFEPKAHAPTCGAMDLCFVVTDPLDAVIDHLTASKVEIIEGPVQRTGALGPIQSVYIRDPDQNLIELSTYEVEGKT